MKADAEPLECAPAPQIKAAADGNASSNKPKEPAAKVTKTRKVLVARISDTHEFGVFPDWCDDYRAANALTIGTKQACEAERDRLNTKRAVTAESVQIPLGATNTQVQQTAVSVQ